MADFEEAGDNDVLRKVQKDLEAKGIAMSEQDLRRAMTDLMEKAISRDQGERLTRRIRAAAASAAASRVEHARDIARKLRCTDRDTR